MRLAIDFMAILGGLLISGGVFKEFGTGYALISGGAFLFVFALLAAKAYERDLDVSNTED